MTLAEIRDFCKQLNIFDNYYIGRLDAKKPKSLGIYSLKDKSSNRVCLGGKSYNGYDSKGVSLLIHGTKNKNETEQLAITLYKALEHVGGNLIYFLSLLQNEPIDVDYDDSGVYEYVIEAVFYYERN